MLRCVVTVLQVLHEGKLAEMRTGEGKTLVAVLPAYLNALKGKGVQVTSQIFGPREKMISRRVQNCHWRHVPRFNCSSTSCRKLDWEIRG